LRLSPRPGLRGYALQTHDGRLRLALINKDLTRPARVSMAAAMLGTATLRLTGPDPAGPAGITTDDVTANGRDEGWAVETVVAKGAGSGIYVEPCSAVLVDLG